MSSDSVLIIGGGIAGVQAALDLADAGAKVILVERSASIGGKMASLDKNFPTLDCSICIEAPKLSEVAEHGNIEILANAEVERVEGESGDFRVVVKQRNTFVGDECTRCDLCVATCPQSVPNEYEQGMAWRKGIYTPFPQAIPGPYTIDIELCMNEPPNYIPCNRCVEACLPDCIDFSQPLVRRFEREVASVIVTTGFDTMDPALLGRFGYGRLPDVLTAMEFERLLTSAGPTGGEIIKPSDGKHPESVLFVLCVGSRDRHFYEYCSRFCCMYSVKHAYQALDHGVKEATVLYMDLRAYGKGFDAFWERTEQEGAHFVRGHPSEITQGERGLVVTYENTDTGVLENKETDLVVLATAVRPPESLNDLAGVLGVEIDDDGFLKAAESRGGLAATTRPGIYAAGCATGPKDIPDSVAEAGAAAAIALTHVTSRSWPREEVVPGTSDERGEPRIGVFLCHCGSNIAGVIDIPEAVDYSRTLTGVVHAQSQMFSCAGNTQQEIVQAIRDHRLNRVVVAACSPKTHEPTFRRVMNKAGLNPFLLEMVNLRNQDSWVHKGEEERDDANLKALDMVRMGVQKALLLEPLEITQQPMVQAALVVGGGVAGMAAAANLARQGIETHLIEKESRLGGILNDLDELAPSGVKAREVMEARSQDVWRSGVNVYLGTEIEMINGHIGNFTARLSKGEEIRAGVVIMATGAVPYQPTEFGYGTTPGVITNLELESANGHLPFDTVTFVGCVGSRRNGAGCSRYCCESMIGQALRLRQAGKQVRVLYREIRTFSRNAEEQYEEAGRAGVQFIKYAPDAPPEEALRFEDGELFARDAMIGADVRIPTDLLVLTVGLQPTEDALSEQLKLAHSEDGFFLERHPKLGPVEAGSPGIFLCGTAQGPKDVREAIAQGQAAAAKAAILLSRDTIEKEPLTAVLDDDKCIYCARCVPACPYGAIEMLGPIKEGPIQIIEAACQGCGACAAECGHDAIAMPYFTSEQILAQIDAALLERPEEKILTFACNWCSYAGADQAGIEKIQYPPSARIIRTMCSARIEEGFVARAFDKGAGAVLITGCRLTEKGSDCHYNYANEQTKKRFDFWQRKYERKGIDPERLQLQWISAAEGKEFAAKIREMDAIVRKHAEGALAGTT